MPLFHLVPLVHWVLLRLPAGIGLSSYCQRLVCHCVLRSRHGLQRLARLLRRRLGRQPVKTNASLSV